MILKKEWVDNINLQGYGFKKKVYISSGLTRMTFSVVFNRKEVTDNVATKITNGLNKEFNIDLKKEDYFKIK